ncbi:HdeD family acid-resistance protein [Flagellimonas pacifica]|nr:DUF308 domain-containing protein [Allomuricauda parva]
MKSSTNLIEGPVNYWYLPVITGLILILIGIWTFASPEEAYLGLSILFSLSFLFAGLVETVFSYANRKNINNWGWHLIFGMATLLLGVFLLTHPEITKTSLALFIGFTLLFRSFNSIGIALDLKKSKTSGWGISLFFGILGVILSFILIRNPLFAGMSIIIWTAISLLTAGIFSVFFGLTMKKINK